jgi:hypothetical protein
MNSVNPAWSACWAGRSRAVSANVIDFVVAEERETVQSGWTPCREAAPRLIELTMRTGNGASRRIEWSAVAADDFLQAVGATSPRNARLKALRQAEEALRHSQRWRRSAS